jgi:hypothetical protein
VTPREEFRAKWAAKREAQDTAVQKLRLAGQSNQEICDALSLSHGQIADSVSRLGKIDRYPNAPKSRFRRTPEELVQIRASGAEKTAAINTARHLARVAQFREAMLTMAPKVAARHVGITGETGKKWRRVYRIATVVQPVYVVQRQQQQQQRLAKSATYRSPLQQAFIDAEKANNWRIIGQFRRNPVPAPPNAEAMIAQAIAQGRVIKCPTGFAAPINNGSGL